MKAIDRAAYWTEMLEQVGFDIECETDTYHDIEFMTVRATKGRSRLWFSVRMDTKFTRFITGSVSSYGWRRSTGKPSKMATAIFSEIELERYKMRQEVTA